MNHSSDISNASSGLSVSSRKSSNSRLNSFLKRFRSRNTSEDSTSSLNSNDGIVKHSTLRKPNVSKIHLTSKESSLIEQSIPEDSVVGNDNDKSIDSEAQKKQLEQAAIDREEKRKRRVADALLSTRRRLDDTTDEILEDMEEAVARAKWNKFEIFSTTCVACFLVFTHPEVQTSFFETVAVDTRIYLRTSFVCLILMLLYSFAISRKRTRDAKQASDDVASRLQDLDEGIKRCELALVHDLQADQEWEKEMENERNEWEIKQKEWEAKRADRLVQSEHRRRKNTRRKRFEEMIRSVPHQIHMPEIPMHIPHIPKIPTLLRKQRSAGSHEFSSSDQDDENTVNAEEENSPSKAWRNYVAQNLTQERMASFTDEELNFEKTLVAHLREKKNAWEELPLDFRMMIVRGYAEKKERLSLSAEATLYIHNWRKVNNCEMMLKLPITDQARKFFTAWPVGVAGEDKYGHCIMYEQIDFLDISVLSNFSDEEMLRFRTQQMEVIRRFKKDVEKKRGCRIAKHIYIVDLKGLSLGKHFNEFVRKKLPMIFKISQEGYPDCLWTLWLINTPFTFRVIWKFVAPLIDPIVKAKVRMLGGSDKFIPEMEKCGMPRASIPSIFGGNYSSLSLLRILEQYVEEDNKEEEETT